MDYQIALERAVIYIENHLDMEIRVEDVARQAGYSYYHFNRLFQAVLGETVGSYIKKRRLAEAAKQLLHSDKRVIDIALEYEFGSSEAFSRAFKAVYGTSPATYRKNRTATLIGNKPRLDSRNLEHLTRRVTVHPQMVTIPELYVAGLRGKTSLDDNVIPALWARLHSMSHLIPNLCPRKRGFGICEAVQEGNTVYTMNNQILFYEVAGWEVTDFDNLPKPFVAKTLRAGRYAVFTHTGSLAALSDTFSYIWGTWLANTDEELDMRDDFELYDERFLGYDHPDSQIDIYIPVR